MRRSLHSKVETIVGLDLSLRAAAACAIPVKWDHDVAKLRTMVIGSSLSNDASEDERLDRIDQICKAMVKFCGQNNAIAIGVEEYAFAQGASHAHAIGELGGNVKRDIRTLLGITPQPIIASTARKTLLQKLPRPKGAKKGFLKSFVSYNVKRLGGQITRWTDDEIDAFVIANARLMQYGGMAMTFEGEMP